MRIGQLARKIGVRPSSISIFLESKDITVDSGSNTKLTKEQEDLVKAEFNYEEKAPPLPDTDRIEEKVCHTDVEEIVSVSEKKDTPSDIKSDQKQAGIDDESIQEPKTPIIKAAHEDDAAATPIVAHNSPEEGHISEEEVEIIRAPKLKLNGLKVIGKIELPEPKIKESAIEESDENDQGKPMSRAKSSSNSTRKTSNHKKSKNRKPKRRLLTLEEKQAKEERIKKRKAKEKKAKEKLVKTAHYQSKMQNLRQDASIRPVKNNKRRSGKTNREAYPENEQRPVPNTIWGKFMYWLNT